ncbi:hypothetical protein A2V56_05665 [Candidatus Woesebacteria bacterium RBG_19FT_COMBO_42_9]|uniref:DUF4352 domain-containing protein n=1 Tax=Candidatus Woesebacteria bacterium RBG_16_42_24 TaxID=1802485 RepID=A0A1F7XL19_9BACT|nr:MAG: hypothetical protein A2V97_02855 [Candidatus Woesebacteria bacterium RBG_16_42_24]OGM16101.1 MAG: hypothetical protein A2V56_05665 [Candidatus Woesebacteria bacterium RBG_19FT_COMBO_42_9]OGM66216.1 MAG: hypothetical protein A2985_00030 [Candidatus Woesebacteria bacterium RIFCSPLOWO2_01_FULL_43_11]
MKTGELKYIFLELVVITGIATGFLLLPKPKATEGGTIENQEPIEDTLGTIVNNEGEVEILVTPKELSGEVWNFEFELNTHSVELDFDLAEASMLVDENGKSHKALGWEGDPPEGHHRRGILKFSPISPKPTNLELRISLDGKERSFKWKME